MTQISNEFDPRADSEGPIVKASRSIDPLDPRRELVRITLRREWYAEAMKAVSDQDRDHDLLADLLLEVADAFVETSEGSSSLASDDQN
jgi:hypothetical protein